MPKDTRPFVGEAGESDGTELLYAVRFPEAACVGVAVQGPNQPSHWPCEFSPPMFWPTVLGMGNPSFGARQQCLGVGASGVAGLDLVAWH